MIGRDANAELERLLPFHVNGTLDRATRGAVDAALPGSFALRAALAEEAALQARVKAAFDMVLAASEAGFAARGAALRGMERNYFRGE
jgi:anti-sigma factor RsiW